VHRTGSFSVFNTQSFSVRKCLASIHAALCVPPTSGASCLHLLRKVRKNETVSSHFMARTCCVEPTPLLLPSLIFPIFPLFILPTVCCCYLFVFNFTFKKEQTGICIYVRLMDKLCKSLGLEYIFFSICLPQSINFSLQCIHSTMTFYIGRQIW